MKDLKNIFMLVIDLHTDTWKSLLNQITSQKLVDNVKQLVIHLYTKEASKQQSTNSDYEEYYNSVLALQKCGFKKWLVKNDQRGMYDSTRSGKRLANAFILHYIKT